jgi:hypothetical protein
MIIGMICGVIVTLFILFIMLPTPPGRKTSSRDRNRDKMYLFIVFGGLLLMWFLFTGWIKKIFRKKKN